MASANGYPRIHWVHLDVRVNDAETENADFFMLNVKPAYTRLRAADGTDIAPGDARSIIMPLKPSVIQSIAIPIDRHRRIGFIAIARTSPCAGQVSQTAAGTLLYHACS
jgi:hypothetical protein